MHVPLLDLQAQYQSIRTEIDAAVSDVFASQAFIGGPTVEACEAAVAAYCGCTYGIGMSSGTDALLAALMAEGMGPGDEVITTPYTFFATAGSIHRLGATPVFVDIDPATFTIDPARIEPAVTERTRAIMPVHLYGRTAEMEPIAAIAARHGLSTIEDACQAIGAEDGGRRAGAMGDYGCFSFYPSKNLPAAGDAGMITTADPDRAHRLRILRNHGMNSKYTHSMIGGNFRLDALQAAVIQVKLPHLDAWTEARQDNAARYAQLFEEHGLVSDPVVLPRIDAADDGERHVVNQYVIRVPRRDDLRDHLRAHDVGCEVYYSIPLHLQECFRDLGYRKGDFPASEEAAHETLAIPIYPELSNDAAAYVVATIAAFYRG